VVRIVWLVVVVAAVAAGVVLVSVGRPVRTENGGAAGRLPMEFAFVDEVRCARLSGLLDYGNLDVQLREHRTRVSANVEVGADRSTGIPSATAAQGARVGALFTACLGRQRFEPRASLRPGGAAALALWSYHRTVYWPCLRAHGGAPGAMRSLAFYRSTTHPDELLPFRQGFDADWTRQAAALRACTFLPNALRDPAAR